MGIFQSRINNQDGKYFTEGSEIKYVIDNGKIIYYMECNDIIINSHLFHKTLLEEYNMYIKYFHSNKIYIKNQKFLLNFDEFKAILIEIFELEKEKSKYINSVEIINGIPNIIRTKKFKHVRFCPI